MVLKIIDAKTNSPSHLVCGVFGEAGVGKTSLGWFKKRRVLVFATEQNGSSPLNGSNAKIANIKIFNKADGEPSYLALISDLLEASAMPDIDVIIIDSISDWLKRYKIAMKKYLGANDKYNELGQRMERAIMAILDCIFTLKKDVFVIGFSSIARDAEGKERIEFGHGDKPLNQLIVYGLDVVFHMKKYVEFRTIDGVEKQVDVRYLQSEKSSELPDVKSRYNDVDSGLNIFHNHGDLFPDRGIEANLDNVLDIFYKYKNSFKEQIKVREG